MMEICEYQHAEIVHTEAECPICKMIDSVRSAMSDLESFDKIGDGEDMIDRAKEVYRAIDKALDDVMCL